LSDRDGKPDDSEHRKQYDGPRAAEQGAQVAAGSGSAIGHPWPFPSWSVLYQKQMRIFLICLRRSGAGRLKRRRQPSHSRSTQANYAAEGSLVLAWDIKGRVEIP
jgi:hypothetical protein